MNAEPLLEVLENHDLSSAFALKVAGWTCRNVTGEVGEEWEMWHDPSGRMRQLPKFAESLDALLPFMSKESVSINRSENWEVVVNGNNMADSSLPRALCILLILAK